MEICFLHPPFDGAPTGGNVYNRNMVELATVAEYPLTSVPLAEEDFDKNFFESLGQPVICDSLFLDQVARFGPGGCGKQALLLHYLPSENPMLDGPERHRMIELENRAIEKSTFLIVSGPRLEKIVKNRYPQKKVFLCEPGVSAPFLEHSLPVDRQASKTVDLLTVANLLPSKGHLQLLRILADLMGENWRWNLVGDDSLDPDFAAYFRDTAQRIGLAPSIRYHGVLNPEQIAALMNRCDIFVSASHYESYGIAMAEAAAKKLPSVITQVGAAGRLVRHDRTGFLIHPRDWDGFRRCLGRLIRESKLRERFRRNLESVHPRTWPETFDDFKTACQFMLKTPDFTNRQ